MQNSFIRFMSTILCLSVIYTTSVNAQNEDRVILIAIDGVRWQDVFSGSDPLLASGPHRLPEDIMPFMWSTIVPTGVIMGNQLNDSIVMLENPIRSSYPSYVEILSGFVNYDIKNNDKIPNPHNTLLGWLANKPKYQDRIAAFTTWGTFPYIIANRRVHLKSGYPSDVQTINDAIKHLKNNDLKLLFIQLDEVDIKGHAKDYEGYLDSLEQADALIGTLWQAVNETPAYKNKTNFIITTDHGRGCGSIVLFSMHGSPFSRSCDRAIWLAANGPSVRMLGEMQSTSEMKATQIAKTIAKILGEDDYEGVPDK